MPKIRPSEKWLRMFNSPALDPKAVGTAMCVELDYLYDLAVGLTTAQPPPPIPVDSIRPAGSAGYQPIPRPGESGRVAPPPRKP